MKPARDTVPLYTADISTFSKHLRQHLADAGMDKVPSHLALLNLLAKSAGYRNYQMLRAAPPAVGAIPAALSSPDADPVVKPIPTHKPIAVPRGSTLPRAARRALAHFDTAGRLMQWPTQYAVQQCAIWGLWLRLPAKRELTEKAVNRYLSDYHLFGDPATLRRELVTAKLLWRTQDCRTYRKEARRPDADVQAFIADLLALSTPAAGRANARSHP